MKMNPLWVALCLLTATGGNAQPYKDPKQPIATRIADPQIRIPKRHAVERHGDGLTLGQRDLEPIVVPADLQRVARASANVYRRRRRIVARNIDQDFCSPRSPAALFA